MPLDVGSAAERRFETGEDAATSYVAPAQPTLQSGPDIGQALRAIREHQGLTVEDVAARTRVRRAYLAAIEDMRLDQLPSRPFTIGYIRAYATALDLDAEAAVARFRAEEPVREEPLRAPSGVHREKDPRVQAVLLVAVTILAAIILWNVARRAMDEDAPPPPTAPEAASQRAMAAAKGGPVSLGAPLPAPKESTTPDLYETPGLAAAGDDGMGNVNAPSTLGQKPVDAPVTDASHLPAVFTPKGAVYGQTAAQPSAITLQALTSASLVVRGADGSVYFARQLAAGEAYRAPSLPALVIEVSEPDAFQVFRAGQTRGLLPAHQIALGKLAVD